MERAQSARWNWEIQGYLFFPSLLSSLPPLPTPPSPWFPDSDSRILGFMTPCSLSSQAGLKVLDCINTAYAERAESWRNGGLYISSGWRVDIRSIQSGRWRHGLRWLTHQELWPNARGLLTSRLPSLCSLSTGPRNSSTELN